MDAVTGVSSNRSFTWWASIVLAGLGLVDALYLSWIKLTGTTASCAGIGDCESVNNSRYAVVAGIPITLLGSAAYLAILVLLFLDGSRADWRDQLRLGVFGIALVGTLYSAYLTYVELAVLKAVCPFCVVSAVAMTILLLLSIVRLREAGAEG